MKIDCFMNMPSHYQADFYRELANLCDLNVWFENNINDDRVHLGWADDKSGFSNETIMNWKKSFFNNDTIYFTNGIPGSIRNLYNSLKSKNNLLAQAEMPYFENHRIRSKIGNNLYSSLMNKNNIPFLGIGKEVRMHMQSLGLKQKLIFPYAYFCSKSIQSKPDFHNPIIFVGQLIKRKRVDLLLEAFSKTRTALEKGLIIIGDGPLKDSLKKYSKKLGIENSVIFKGTLNNKLILNEISKSSCLVLPSDHDGWGVVANESINCDVPVVISDKCGASEIVSQGCGLIFQAGSVDSLIMNLGEIFSTKEYWEQKSYKCSSVSESISPKTGAKYFIQIVEFMKSNFNSNSNRPAVPWLKV